MKSRTAACFSRSQVGEKVLKKSKYSSDSLKKGSIMKKGGVIVCLLIALGYPLGCGQKDTPEKSESPTQVEPVNAGYKDFKFGMKGSDLKAFNDRVQACERIEGPEISEKESKWIGVNCYEIGGKKRNIAFRARAGDEKIVSIDILMGS